MKQITINVPDNANNGEVFEATFGIAPADFWRMSTREFFSWMNTYERDGWKVADRESARDEVDRVVLHLEMVKNSYDRIRAKRNLDSEERAMIDDAIRLIWKLKGKADRLVYENEKLKRRGIHEGADL